MGRRGLNREWNAPRCVLIPFVEEPLYTILPFAINYPLLVFSCNLRPPRAQAVLDQLFELFVYEDGAAEFPWPPTLVCRTQGP
jgi:hypothetical protein